MAARSYIANMMNQYGENWIVNVSPEAIQRSTKKIVKDIGKAIINYDVEGKYFLDTKFLENLIIGISNELEINTLNYNACCFYSQYYQSQNLSIHITHLHAVIYIYQTILEKLQCIKSTQNIGYLTDTPGLLFNYKKHLETL